ncbi:MAG: hypothetical protein QOI13_1564 [Paraburkholderia sp.]|jgi:hypothetical protein|nr:hypothetical protein [Paraburkholderia sp.]
MNLVHFIQGGLNQPRIPPVGPADIKQPKKGKKTLGAYEGSDLRYLAAANVSAPVDRLKNTSLGHRPSGSPRTDRSTNVI